VHPVKRINKVPNIQVLDTQYTLKPSSALIEEREQDDTFSLLRAKIQSMEEDLQVLCENNLEGKDVQQVRKEL